MTNVYILRKVGSLNIVEDLVVHSVILQISPETHFYSEEELITKRHISDIRDYSTGQKG